MTGRFFAGELRLEPAQVASWVMAEHARTGLPVLIRGDRKADFGVALELLADLQAAGLEAVSFQVAAPAPSLQGGASAEAEWLSGETAPAPERGVRQAAPP